MKPLQRPCLCCNIVFFYFVCYSNWFSVTATDAIDIGAVDLHAGHRGQPGGKPADLRKLGSISVLKLWNITWPLHSIFLKSWHKSKVILTFTKEICFQRHIERPLSGVIFHCWYQRVNGKQLYLLLHSIALRTVLLSSLWYGSNSHLWWASPKYKRDARVTVCNYAPNGFNV